jgi:hypothetical protein
MKINPNAFPNDAHQEFYRWQIEQQEEEWKRYSNCQMKILIEEGKLFLGRIWGTTVDGNVVLRFKSNIVPRIKQEYQLCLLGQMRLSLLLNGCLPIPLLELQKIPGYLLKTHRLKQLVF